MLLILILKNLFDRKNDVALELLGIIENSQMNRKLKIKKY